MKTDIEEAAKEYAAESVYYGPSNIEERIACSELDFIQGAKWAEENNEKKFTKEDMINFALATHHEYTFPDGPYEKNMNEVFNDYLKENYEK